MQSWSGWNQLKKSCAGERLDQKLLRTCLVHLLPLILPFTVIIPIDCLEPIKMALQTNRVVQGKTHQQLQHRSQEDVEAGAVLEPWLYCEYCNYATAFFCWQPAHGLPRSKINKCANMCKYPNPGVICKLGHVSFLDATRLTLLHMLHWCNIIIAMHRAHNLVNSFAISP